MKTINTFLIEKLKLARNINSKPKQGYCDWETVELPKLDFDNEILHMKQVWRKMSLPKCKYVIFKDMYRAGYPHFNTISDFIYSITYFQDDYENFDPTKDILYASDDLKEILEWYFEYLHCSEFPKESDFKENIDYQDAIENWADNNDSHFSKSNDNCQVMAKVYAGIDNYYEDAKEIKDYKNSLRDIYNEMKETNMFDIKD